MQKIRNIDSRLVTSRSFNILSGAFLLVLLLSSCTKNFDLINTDPNDPPFTNPNYLFTEAVLKGSGTFNTGIHTEIWSMMDWTMMVANLEGNMVPGRPYQYGGAWNDELWNEWYTQALAPTNEVMRLTETDPFAINKHSIARIWRVYLFHRITDLWGDVPYSEALKGISSDGTSTLNPVYDTQEAIYTDLLAELKEAVEAFDSEADEFGAADPFYNGDLDSWAKFANSLRLRLCIRIYAKDPTLATTHLTELMLEENFINYNYEGAHFRWNSINKGPFFSLWESAQGRRQPSKFLVDYLKATSDPRISEFAQVTPESELSGSPDYQGIPNLVDGADLSSYSLFNTSELGPRYLSATDEGTTLSYAETSFLRAEAALLGFGSISPLAAYEAGVRAHMEYFGIGSTEIDDYLAGPGAYDGTLEQIITQKWLTFVYKDGYEAYAELRRTGFPVLKDIDNLPIDLENLPKRFSYPFSEVSLNGTNVSAVGEGINDTSTPVWWAK